MHFSRYDLMCSMGPILFVGLGVWGERRNHRWVEWPCKVMLGLLEIVL